MEQQPSFLSKLNHIWTFFRNGFRMPSKMLKELILDVENREGYDRNDARATAKAWLLSHVSSMGQQDILLARTHFGYLLPADWGL